MVPKQNRWIEERDEHWNSIQVVHQGEVFPLHIKLRLNPESSSAFLNPEIATMLERLFLTLTFPGGSSFTARAIYTTSRLFLLFRTFFPTDTGPLPVPKAVPEELDNVS